MKIGFGCCVGCNHSRQLAEMIPRWLENMNFTECEYKYGRALFQEQIVPSSTARHPSDRIPHIDQLIDHLEIGYPEMMNRYCTIRTNHKQRSLKIREIMTAQHTNSFQKIIIDRISSLCPKLRNISELRKPNKNLLLEQQYNVYDDISIFDMVFSDLFNGWSVGFLDVKDSTELWYRNSDTKMIAKGNKDDMEKLKELKNELFHNRDLQNIIEKYTALREGLIHDNGEQQLR